MKATVPVNPEAVFPFVSFAIIVTVNAVPALTVVPYGVVVFVPLNVKEVAFPGVKVRSVVPDFVLEVAWNE